MPNLPKKHYYATILGKLFTYMCLAPRKLWAHSIINLCAIYKL